MSSPRGKRRLLITKVTGPQILLIIQRWPLDQHLGWDTLMDLINARYSGKWKRQTVQKHGFLQEAFTLRQKDQLEHRHKAAKKAGKRIARPRNVEVAYLKSQIELLFKEVADLKVQVVICENRLARWRHNALMHRMTIAQLDEELQENDRGRSDR